MQRQFNFYLFAMSQDTMQGFAPAAFNAPMFQQPPPALPGAVGGNMGGVTNQPMNLNGMMGGMNAGSGGYRCGVMLISWGKKYLFLAETSEKVVARARVERVVGRAKAEAEGRTISIIKPHQSLCLNKEQKLRISLPHPLKNLEYILDCASCWRGMASWLLFPFKVCAFQRLSKAEMFVERQRQGQGKRWPLACLCCRCLNPLVKEDTPLL